MNQNNFRLVQNIKPFHQSMMTDLDIKTLLECDILHELDVFDCRRQAFDLAIEHNFSRKQAFYIVTLITELGNNIVFHSVGGSLKVKAHNIQHLNETSTETYAMSIVASDNGPGIEDIQLAFQEGYSTRNSLGCGLSGASRLSNEIKVESSPCGTKVEAVIVQESFEAFSW